MIILVIIILIITLLVIVIVILIVILLLLLILLKRTQTKHTQRRGCALGLPWTALEAALWGCPPGGYVRSGAALGCAGCAIISAIVILKIKIIRI